MTVNGQQHSPENVISDTDLLEAYQEEKVKEHLRAENKDPKFDKSAIDFLRKKDPDHCLAFNQNGEPAMNDSECYVSRGGRYREFEESPDRTFDPRTVIPQRKHLAPAPNSGDQVSMETGPGAEVNNMPSVKGDHRAV